MHARVKDDMTKRHIRANPALPVAGHRSPQSAPESKSGLEPWRERFCEGCKNALGDVGDLVHEGPAEDEYDLFLLLDRWRANKLSRLVKVGRAARTAVKRAINHFAT